MKNSDLIQRDLSNLWPPCTQMKDHEWLPLVPIKKGDGVWLEDFEDDDDEFEDEDFDDFEDDEEFDDDEDEADFDEEE